MGVIDKNVGQDFGSVDTAPMVKILDNDDNYLELPKDFSVVAEYRCNLVTYLVIQKNANSENDSNSDLKTNSDKIVVPKSKFFSPKNNFPDLNPSEHGVLVEHMLDYQVFKSGEAINTLKEPVVPFSFLIKDSSLNIGKDVEPYRFVEITEMVLPDENSTYKDAVAKFCLITADGKKFTLKDLLDLYNSSLIAPNFFGYILYYFLSKLETEFLERFLYIIESEIRFKNGPRNDFTRFKLDSSWGAYLYISDLQDESYQNALRIASFEKLAEVFSFFNKFGTIGVLPFDKVDRLVLNPIVSDELEIYRPQAYAKVGRVLDVDPKRRHFCHDAIFLQERGLAHRGVVIDGAGGHPGGALFSAFIVDQIAKGLNPAQLKSSLALQRFKTDFDAVDAKLAGRTKKEDIGINDYPVAVFAGVNFTKMEGKRLEMESLGDSVAIHLDKNLRFLGLVGSESSNYSVLAKDENITDAQISQYISSSYIDSFLAPHKVDGSIARYSAKLKKGDIIIVASDWIEKVFNKAMVMQLFRANKINPEIEYTYETAVKGDILERGIIENRNRKSRLYGVKVFPFITMLGKFAESGKFSFEYEQLVEFLKSHIPNAEDDGSLICYQI